MVDQQSSDLNSSLEMPTRAFSSWGSMPGCSHLPQMALPPKPLEESLNHSTTV